MKQNKYRKIKIILQVLVTFNVKNTLPDEQ